MKVEFSDILRPTQQVASAPLVFLQSASGSEWFLFLSFDSVRGKCFVTFRLSASEMIGSPDKVSHPRHASAEIGHRLAKAS